MWDLSVFQDCGAEERGFVTREDLAVSPRPYPIMSDFTFTFHFHALEKEMATHSSVLAWRIPGMGDPVVTEFFTSENF